MKCKYESQGWHRKFTKCVLINFAEPNQMQKYTLYFVNTLIFVEAVFFYSLVLRCTKLRVESRRKYYWCTQNLFQLLCNLIVLFINIAIAILDFSLLLPVKLSVLAVFASIFGISFCIFLLALSDYHSLSLLKATEKNY